MERSIPVNIVLTVLTCGIYGIYWFVVITDDLNSMSNEDNDTSGGISFLLAIVTCGIYGIYWAYRMGQKVTRLKEERNIGGSDEAILYLILYFFNLGIIVFALAQNEINLSLASRKEIPLGY